MVTIVHRSASIDLNNSVENFNSPRLGDLLASAWRYRWSAIALTVLFFPVFAAVVFLIPAKYDSSARLLVRLGRGAVSIDPTANLSQTISLQENRLAQVNSVKELLSSQELAKRVVKDIGAKRILEPHGPLETSLKAVLDSLIPTQLASAAGNLSAEQVEQQLTLEAACQKFADSVSIFAPKEAYTISLDIRTGDPFLSHDLMQTLITHYQRYHVEAHQSTGSLAFFEAQAAEAHRRAQDAQLALRDAKTGRGIVELSAAKLALGTSISTLKQNVLATENELASAEAELANLQSQIVELPSQIESEVTRGIPKVAGSGMRQRLYDLEVAYQEAASKFTGEHPKMVSLRDQLESASVIAQTEQGDQPQTRESVNPVRQQLELAFKSATAKRIGTRTKSESLQAQLATLTSELEQLNQTEVELNQLTWEATLAESEYMRSAAARSTARQIEELDNQHLSEISIVQPATLALKKASPKRLVLLVLAAALALAIGLGQAMLRDVLSAPDQRGLTRTHSSMVATDSISPREQEWEQSVPEPQAISTRKDLVGAASP